MRSFLKLLALFWLLVAIDIDQWQQVHAGGDQLGTLVEDTKDTKNPAKGYLIETSFILRHTNSYYTGSQLNELVVDEDRRLVSITYSSENEHLNSHKVGLSRIQQQWDLGRQVENRIDLSYESCHSRAFDGPSSIFSRSRSTGQPGDKGKCRSEPVRLILGNYFYAKETRQLVMPIYNHQLLRWVLADVRQGTDHKINGTHYEISGIDDACLYDSDISQGKNFRWIDHSNSSETIKFTVSDSSESWVRFNYFVGETLVSIEILVRRLAKMDLGKLPGVSDIDLYANTKLCHDTLGRLKIDYPVLIDTESNPFVSNDTGENLMANLVKLYSLDSRRITKLEVDQDKQLATGFITVNIELLEKSSKFEAGKKPVELPVLRDLGISQKILSRMLNMSTISLPASNTDECVKFCKKHDCNTLVHCQEWNECHIYLYAVGLPGSFKQLSSSNEPVCRTIEMRPKYKPLAGWPLQEVKKHLKRFDERYDKSDLNLDIKMQNQMIISPSKIKFDIINIPTSNEILKIPEDRYKLISSGHKLDAWNMNSTFLVIKNVNRIQECVELCDKQETCISMSYCRSTESSCVLARENYITFPDNRKPQINPNSSSMIEDANCLTIGKRLSKEFHEVLNKNRRRADVGPEQWVNEEVDYCAVRCLIDNIRGRSCNSFEIRGNNDMKHHPDCYYGPDIGNYDGPFITYARDILLQFKPILGHMLPDDVKITQKNIVNAEQCAQFCLDSNDCGAFEYCNIRGAGYMEFYPWCSIGLAPTVSSDPTTIHTSNLFCSVYRLKNQISNWSYNYTSEADNDHDRSETKDAENDGSKQDAACWPKASIALLLITGFAVATGLTYFVGMRSRNNSDIPQTSCSTRKSSNTRSQDINDRTSIELQDVNIYVNPVVIVTNDNSLDNSSKTTMSQSPATIGSSPIKVAKDL